MGLFLEQVDLVDDPYLIGPGPRWKCGEFADQIIPVEQKRPMIPAAAQKKAPGQTIGRGKNPSMALLDALFISFLR